MRSRALIVVALLVLAGAGLCWLRRAGPSPGENTAEWPGWRGANRDGHAAWLPEKLPTSPRLVWRRPLHGTVLAGAAVAGGFVIVADRDLFDTKDAFHCLRAADGAKVWDLEYAAPGSLDYGCSPRATPMIHDGKACLLGAFGALHCVELATGRVIWEKDLGKDFSATRPDWGWTGAPLIVDDKLIVNPGATNAALVALDLRTGAVVWKTPGSLAAYAALICGRFGDRREIVGYDKVSLGGWDPQTGRRIWKLVPPDEGDFNVPTPMEFEGKLLVATEGNGARLYSFDAQGKIIPRPVAVNTSLSPEANTPVIVGGKVIGCSAGLHALDLNSGLKTLWTDDSDVFSDFASLIVSGDRVLAATFHGDLWLMSPKPDGPGVISRLHLFSHETELYAHPALCGHRLFIMDGASVCCLDFDATTTAAAAISSNPPATLGKLP